MNLSLRCIERSDIENIAKLANDFGIAEMTANLPYPYTTEHASAWLDYVETNSQEHVFAIDNDNKLIGIIGLVHEAEHRRAELGYWLGREYWNKGYMCMAVEMAVAFAFSMLDINKVYSRCFSVNTASIKVLEKNHFVPEGSLKQHYIRMGVTRDILYYGLLKDDYLTNMHP